MKGNKPLFKIISSISQLPENVINCIISIANVTHKIEIKNFLVVSIFLNNIGINNANGIKQAIFPNKFKNIVDVSNSDVNIF